MDHLPFKCSQRKKSQSPFTLPLFDRFAAFCGAHPRRDHRGQRMLGLVDWNSPKDKQDQSIMNFYPHPCPVEASNACVVQHEAVKRASLSTIPVSFYGKESDLHCPSRGCLASDFYAVNTCSQGDVSSNSVRRPSLH